MIRYHTHIFEKNPHFVLFDSKCMFGHILIEVILHGPKFSFEKWNGIAYIHRLLTLHLCVINIRAKELDRHSIVDVGYVCPLLKIEHTAL